MTLKPPVTSLIESLPYTEIPWERFETLTMDLAQKLNPSASVSKVGTLGNDQQGIDIYVFEPGREKGIFIQCKRYKEAKPGLVEKAVQKFLEGEYAHRAHQFILCTSIPLNSEKLEREKLEQREKLLKKSIDFQPWEPQHLNGYMFLNPQIVYRHFNEYWVKAFNGEIALFRMVADNLTVKNQEYTPPPFYISRFLSLELYKNHSPILFSSEEQKNEKPTLDSLIENQEKITRIILMASAGSGKSVEIQHVAAKFSRTDSIYFPIVAKLKNYTGQTIEVFLEEQHQKWTIFPQDKMLLLLDGLDEVLVLYYNTFISKINNFCIKYPSINIIITSRNIAYQSSASPATESISGFEVYYLQPPVYEQIVEFLKQRLENDYQSFMDLLFEKRLAEWLNHPFFLNLLIEKYIQDSTIPEKKSQLISWFIENRIVENKLKYKHNYEVFERLQREIMLSAERLAFVMTALERIEMPIEDIMVFFTDQEIKNLKFSEVVTSNGNISNSYSFEHNNFREFLAARYLITKLSERIFEIITFAPLNRRIKPRWINTLAFIYELLEQKSPLLSRLNKWIFTNQPEAFLEIEPDKISNVIRAAVFKQIILHKKQTSGYVYSQQTHPDKLAALANDNTDSINFLHDELKQTSVPSLELYKRDLLYIMQQLEEISSHESSEEIRNVLWEIVSQKVKDATLVMEAIGNLEKHFGLSEMEIAKIVHHCPAISDLRVREIITRVFTHLGLADKYIDFIIKSIELQEETAKTDHRTIPSPGSHTRLAILELSEYSSVTKILKFFRKKIYLFRDKGGMRYRFDLQFQQDFFNHIVSTQTITAEILKEVLYILDEFLSSHHEYDTKPIVDLLEHSGNRQKVIKRFLKKDIKKSSGVPHFVRLLREEDYEWLENILTKKKARFDILAVINWIGYFGDANLRNLFHEKHLASLTEEKRIELTKPVDWKKIKIDQEKQNEELLLNRDLFLAEGKKLFNALGKDVLTYRDIQDYHYPEGIELKLEQTIVIDTITRKAAKTELYEVKSFFEYFQDDKNWEKFIINYIVSRLHDGNAILHENLINFAKAYFNRFVNTINFNSASRHNPQAILLTFFMTELNFETSESKYLEMLAFDDSGIHEYPDEKESEKRLSEFIIARIPDRQKIIKQLTINLQSGKLLPAAKLNHFRVLSKIHSSGIAQFLTTALEDPELGEADKEDIVSLAVSTPQGISVIKRVLSKCKILPMWSRPALTALTNAKDDKAHRLMALSLEQPENTIEFKSFLANNIMRYGNVQGFVFHFNHFITGTETYFHSDSTEIFDAVKYISHGDILPFIRIFLQNHYEKNPPGTEAHHSAFEIIIEAAGAVANQSPQALEDVLYVLEIIAWMYKDNNPNASNLFNRMKLIENNFYISHEDGVSIDDVLEYINSAKND